MPELARALRAAEDPDVASAIVTVLHEIGPEAAPALPALFERLADSDEILSRLAIQATVGIDPRGRDTARALEAALGHPSREVRQAAAEALKKIQGDKP